jgi:hypothetical protein
MQSQKAAWKKENDLRHKHGTNAVFNMFHVVEMTYLLFTITQNALMAL